MYKRQLYNLIGGESFRAAHALTSSAYAFAFIGGAGVYDLAFGVTAKWTFHIFHSVLIYCVYHIIKLKKIQYITEKKSGQAEKKSGQARQRFRPVKTRIIDFYILK